MRELRQVGRLGLPVSDHLRLGVGLGLRVGLGLGLPVGDHCGTPWLLRVNTSDHGHHVLLAPYQLLLTTKYLLLTTYRHHVLLAQL